MSKSMPIIIAALVAFAAGIAFFLGPGSKPPQDQGVACTMEAKQCPDGSYVGRVPPSCAFALCPGESLRASSSVPKENLPFELPAGFEISTFAENVSNARVIAFDPKGVMLVSQPAEGKVSALRDTDGDGKTEMITAVISGLRKPHGMAFRCGTAQCKLYVAEEDALSVFDYDATSWKATGKKKLLDLPAGAGHFTRTLLFLPAPNENTLLISVGSSCNVCREEDSRRAAILSYDIKTGKSEAYAKGLRNAVFMTVQPGTNKVFATEMGRDSLGDDIPPDEINIIEPANPSTGLGARNYGWPNCYGKNIHDTNFDKNTYIRNPCMKPFETPSLIDLQAHSAPLGLAFAPQNWPAEYRGNLLAAFHGSWNRSVPTGYKVVRVKLNAKGEYVGIEDFLTGFLRPDGAKIGRPVDIKILSDGTMYISDDDSGKIYRVIKK